MVAREQGSARFCITSQGEVKQYQWNPGRPLKFYLNLLSVHYWPSEETPTRSLFCCDRRFSAAAGLLVSKVESKDSIKETKQKKSVKKSFKEGQEIMFFQ